MVGLRERPEKFQLDYWLEKSPSRQHGQACGASSAKRLGWMRVV